MSSNIDLNKICAFCGKEFIAHKTTTTCCSHITEFYTTQEILKRYGISNSGLYKMAQTQNFPKTLSRGKILMIFPTFHYKIWEHSHMSMSIICKILPLLTGFGKRWYTTRV